MVNMEFKYSMKVWISLFFPSFKSYMKVGVK